MENRFETFTSLISSINRCIQKIKDIEMKELGLKGNQVLCLYYLNNASNGLQFSELCRLCDEDKAAISRTLKDLQERGFVLAASKNDKKYKNAITLSEAGKNVSLEIAQKIDNFVNIGSRGISPNERETLYYTLHLIADNLQKSFKGRNNND